MAKSVSVQQNAITGEAPSYSDMLQRVAELEAKLAASRPAGTLTLKASGKGAVSIYGLYSRFPISLYSSALKRLEEAGILIPGPTLRDWMKANASKLSNGKDDPKFAAAAKV